MKFRTPVYIRPESEFGPLSPIPAGKRSDGRALSRRWPVPLTVIAELLFCEVATPYRAAKRFGLEPWVRSRLRAFLTQGPSFCAGLDLQRAIRFNQAYLERRAEFVLDRRRGHRGRRLDPKSLAMALDMWCLPKGIGFLGVWKEFLRRLANQLVNSVNVIYAEDVPLARAERHFDRFIVARPRVLARPPVELEESDYFHPVSLTGGVRRYQRILAALKCRDPEAGRQLMAPWDVAHLRDRDACGQIEWECDIDALGRTEAELRARIQRCTHPWGPENTPEAKRAARAARGLPPLSRARADPVPDTGGPADRRRQCDPVQPHSGSQRTGSLPPILPLIRRPRGQRAG